MVTTVYHPALQHIQYNIFFVSSHKPANSFQLTAYLTLCCWPADVATETVSAIDDITVGPVTD